MNTKKTVLSTFIILCLCLWPAHTQESENSDPRVKKIVKASLKTNSTPTIVALKGGLSGCHLLKITVDHHEYVLRLIGQHSKMDIEREIEAQNTASQAGYGPKVINSSINDAYILMDFIKPQPLTNEVRSSMAFYKSLGILLKTIHSGPAFLKNPTIMEQVNRRYGEIKWDKLPCAIHTPLKEMWDKLQQVLSKHPNFTPTHRDLNPNNILMANSKLFVIDFENASQDDPYFDLATIGIFYLFEETHTKAFLESYFERAAKEQEMAKFYLMKQVALIFYALELLAKIPNQDFSHPTLLEPLATLFSKINSHEINLEENDGKGAFALGLVQEAINNSHTKEFAKSLDILA